MQNNFFIKSIFESENLDDIWICFISYFTYRSGKLPINHPDDEDRFGTRYQRRDDAVQNRLRGREHKKEARMVGYAVSSSIYVLKIYGILTT